MDKKRIVGAKMEDGIIGKSVISRFRCVLVKQMQYFLPPNTYSYRENHALAVCKYLIIPNQFEFLFRPGDLRIAQAVPDQESTADSDCDHI